MPAGRSAALASSAATKATHAAYTAAMRCGDSRPRNSRDMGLAIVDARRGRGNLARASGSAYGAGAASVAGCEDVSRFSHTSSSRKRRSSSLAAAWDFSPSRHS